MVECRYKLILILFSFILIPTILSAPLTNVSPDPYTVKDYNFESTTNKINPSTVPLTELIQFQTEEIKKILSTSLQSSLQDPPKEGNKCEDIEAGIKASIHKPSIQEEYIHGLQNEEDEVTENEERGDAVTEDTDIKSERKPEPSGRTLFSLYRENIAKTKENNSPQNSDFFPRNQNIILVPCTKTVIRNETGYDSRQDYEYKNYGLSKNYSPQQSDEQLIHSTEANKEYVLEKVYAPNGYLLYYMYRPRNLSPEQSTIDSSTTTSTTSATPATTTTTTSSNPPEPKYKEQLRFVVQIPYANSEQILPYGYKFDQYAYYPPEFQPSYVNGPVEYKPTFHMIRTLVIPNEYTKYNSEEQNSQNEPIQ